MRPWQTIDAVQTAEGELKLHRRDERDFRMTIDGRVLMVSRTSHSEQELARLACACLVDRPAPRVLIGGLGMAFTLRAALDALPPRAAVTVCEITPAVVRWCQGPLSELTGHAVDDPRVSVVVADVAGQIRDAPPGSLDAILLDLYEGPNEARRGANLEFYGEEALAASRAALRKGGVFAVWSEDPDAAFEKRLRAARFRTERHRIGGGGRRHVVYLARV